METRGISPVTRLALAATRMLTATLALTACGLDYPDDVPAFTKDPLSTKQGYMVELGVPQAWERERGSVIVAVLDNGVDTSHPDLQGRLWTNPKEVEDGQDNDGDGRVDDIHGWNFLDQNGDITVASEAEPPEIGYPHATAVAGIIAAETDNGEGVAGLCPGCSLMILKARDFTTSGSVLWSMGAAIEYAIEHGARVIDISDGTLATSLLPEDMDGLSAAAQRAEEAGIVIVASAGNDGRHTVRWPAAIPSVIAVAAVDWEGKPEEYTSFGAEIDVAATGEFVHTTMIGNTYDYFRGTSASAPIVAALAALLLSAKPEMSPAEVAERIRATAKPADIEDRPDVKDLFGAGIVSFSGALDF
jgi:subtilisin family serine protease